MQFNEGSLIKLLENQEDQHVKDPTEMEFSNHTHKVERPFVVYMDCEPMNF